MPGKLCYRRDNPLVHLDGVGSCRFELFADACPVMVANFMDLVELGFYNHMPFHVVRPGCYVQSGCVFSVQPGVDRSLHGTGSAPPRTEFRNRINTSIKYKRDEHGFIPDEASPKGEQFSNTFGSIAMAHCGPGTMGSQFFINLGDNSCYDWWNTSSPDKHMVFGRLISPAAELRVNDRWASIWKICVDGTAGSFEDKVIGEQAQARQDVLARAAQKEEAKEKKAKAKAKAKANEESQAAAS